MTEPPLPKRLRTLLYTPWFYRVRALDLFLPAFFLVSILGLLFLSLLARADAMPVMLVFFLLLMLVMNRFVWLASGRGRILPEKIHYALLLLLSEAQAKNADSADNPAGDEYRFALIPFCVHARISWQECNHALDRVMKETNLRGYLQYGTMELVLTSQPIVRKRCAVCSAILSDTMVVERACGMCGTYYYI